MKKQIKKDLKIRKLFKKLELTSSILKNMINMKAETYYKFSKYGFLFLLLLINIP